MSDPYERIVVREFLSEAEIKSLEGYKDENPVTKGNYKALLGHYHLPEQLRCCHQRDSGTLCKQSHIHGFVLLLVDRSVTIIGNICLNKHFDAEAEISKDRARYENEKRRLEGLARLQELLAGKDADLQRLRELRENMTQLKQRTAFFRDGVGTSCATALEEMLKVGRREVVITGIRIRHYVEDGERLEERTRHPLSLGTLVGLEIFRPSAYQAILDRINAIARAYSLAENLPQPIRNKNLDEVRSVLSNSPGVAADCARLLEAEKAFRASDLWTLSFLTNDQGERYKIARYVLGQGKEGAKEWLQAKERALKSAHGIERLEMVR